MDSLTYTINLKDNFTNKLGSISNGLTNVGQKVEEVKSKSSGGGGIFGGLFGQMTMANLASTALTKSLGLVTGAVSGLLTNAAKSYGTFEQYEVALSGLVKNKDELNQHIKDVSKFATETPFTLPEVQKLDKQLLSLGLSTQTVNERMKLIGDIASGSNTSLDQMGGYFAKVQNQGKLTGEVFNSMLEASIPMGKAFENVGMSMDEVREKMAKGELSNETFLKAMSTLNSNGGIYMDSMIKQSQTFNGLMSTLQGNVESMFVELGKELIEPIKPFISMANELLVKVTPALAGAAKDFMGFLLPLVQKIMGMAKMLVPVFKGIKSMIDPIIKFVGDLINEFAIFFEDMLSFLGEDGLGAIQKRMEFVGEILGSIGTVLIGAFKLIATTIKVLLIPGIYLFKKTAMPLQKTFEFLHRVVIALINDFIKGYNQIAGLFGDSNKLTLLVDPQAKKLIEEQNKLRKAELDEQKERAEMIKKLAEFRKAEKGFDWAEHNRKQKEKNKNKGGGKGEGGIDTITSQAPKVINYNILQNGNLVEKFEVNNVLDANGNIDAPKIRDMFTALLNEVLGRWTPVIN